MAIGRRRLLLFLISGLGVMAGGLIGPALPGIEEALGSGGDSSIGVRLVLTVPALFMAISAAVSSKVVQSFGKRRTLIFALVGYGVAGTSGAFATTLTYLLITRALLGLATGLAMTTTIALIADYYEGEVRTRTLGQQAAFMSIGSIVVAFLAGLLASVSWRATFLCYGLALLLILPTILMLREPEADAKEQQNKLESAERQLIIGLALTAFITMISFYLIPTLLPFILRAMGYPSPAVAGSVIALCMLTSALASFSFGRLKKSISHPVVLMIAMAVMSGSYFLLGHAAGFMQLAAATVTFGIGVGFVLPTLSDWAAQAVRPSSRNLAIGIITMGLFLGQFVSPLASHPIIETFGEQSAFEASAILTLMASLFVLIRTRMGIKGIKQNL